MELRYIIIIFCCLLSLNQSAHSKDKTNKHSHHQTQQYDYRALPEAETKRVEKKQVTSRDYMIVTANPYATRAGNEILKRGGSAVDAAITAQLVLNIVEPQSSGIGGGAFLVHWDEKRKRLTSYDGRETAPASVKPDYFMNEDGSPMDFRKIVKKGMAIGVPGTLKLLEDMHRRHGKLPWKELFKPAIDLAYNGFSVSERLNKLLSLTPSEKFHPVARNFFYPHGNACPIGLRLKNPVLGKTFETIAEQGTKAFYKGDIAKLMVHRINEISGGRNSITMEDLANYRVIKREPICITYRGYKICGMGPPTSGGLTVAQTLKLIEPYNLGKTPLNAKAMHIITEAQKLAYADRGRYHADSDFVKVPVKDLLNKDYLNKRRQLIHLDKSMGKATPGKPDLEKQAFFGKDGTAERPGTSHLSIIDKEGNAVSMTTTLETGFGSKVMVAGFLLNSELTDFSRKSKDENGNFIANRIEPGKRPRSSMSPTIILDKDNKLHIVLGSPGGSRIIIYVLKTIIGLIDWQLDAQHATKLANFGSRNGPLEIEDLPETKQVIEKLKEKGHQVKIIPKTSGIHLIVKKDGMLHGGVDPSREGYAMGK